jgi:ParB family chromosome partitioning protein
MKIDIERIKVDETNRIRQDIGDLKSLEESIQQVGLINPVLVDENYNLVAGFRRLTACRNLGWQEIEANVVELGGDELKILEAEVAENLFRKEFTPDEIVAIQKRREEIAEARRPKGAFERFWNWIKALFQSDLADEPESPPKPVTVAPSPEPEKDVQEEAADEEVTESEEQAQPEQEAEPEPAIETTHSPSPSPQPKSAEIVERDGVRHIKWR